LVFRTWYLSIVEILVAQHLAHPEDGFGLQQAVLEEVATGSRGPTTLLWTSSRYIGATHLETRLTNFGVALRLAEQNGFPVLVRNSGGGAVAANEGSISFSLTFRVEDLRHGLYKRYAEGAELIVSALKSLGVAAEAGEVEGEFCPGAYSVRVGGPLGIKIAGLAQRVTRRAARLEALVLVTRTAELKGVLELFYGALGIPFRPESIADLPETDVPKIIEALTEAVRVHYAAREAKSREETFVRARALRERWRATSGASGQVFDSLRGEAADAIG
jgi:octanoyl-[GcvH]:protein N-octanoyltransferase